MQPTFAQQSLSSAPPVTQGDGTALGVDLSSWVSWAAYSAGLLLAFDAHVARDLLTFGMGSRVLAGTIAVFFCVLLAIQRHMSLALSANTFGEPARLVTSGVFRYSRNPIYVAFLLPILSLGWFSAWAALAAAAIYVAAMTLVVIRREEAVLEARFGETYRAYRARVPRWL